MPEGLSHRPLRLAVLARAVHPLHGVGGLERHVYDLVRHLVMDGGAHVTLITRPPTTSPSPGESAAAFEPATGEGDATSDTAAGRGAAAGVVAGTPTSSATSPPASSAASSATVDATLDDAAAARFGLPREAFRVLTVPYVTFPGAGRRGTTVADRSTAYPLFGWRAGRVAVKLVRRGEIDIVHALGASGLGYAMARRRHEPTVPFVFNPQGLEEFGATDPGRARLKRLAYAPLQVAVRACARAADVVIATDRALVPTVLRHLPIDAARVEVVPNAIDLAAIERRHSAASTAALRARFGLDPSTPILLSVGRLEENKGFHVAARAFGELLRRDGPATHAAATGAPPHDAAGARGEAAHPPAVRDWRWVLVGDGPYRATIERVAAAEGLASRMIMAGRAPDDELHAWYETARLFVHPTLYEGSSLVTLEAMAHGRAIVATRAGGLPDKVQPGVNGWLVEPDRADLLAAAIADALDQRTDLARMGEASRALVAREFAWPVVAARMMTIYTTLQTA